MVEIKFKEFQTHGYSLAKTYATRLVHECVYKKYYDMAKYNNDAMLCFNGEHKWFIGLCKSAAPGTNKELCQEFGRNVIRIVCDIVTGMNECSDATFNAAANKTTTRRTLPPIPRAPLIATTTTGGSESAPFPIVHVAGGFAWGALLIGILLTVVFVICSGKKKKEKKSVAGRGNGGLDIVDTDI
ncbi:unnamed protein product [Caenorhabditis sp. 36 PRJEB53466]|nr:unnamed protein product [Caenorhabditis sp. 36 PRJEB53466]